MVAKPTPVQKPTAVPNASTEPVVKAAPLSTRRVKRYIAVCPFLSADVVPSESADVECPFNERKKPELHKTDDSADVESGKHIRATHARELHAERTVVVRYQRTFVDEAVEV